MCESHFVCVFFKEISCSIVIEQKKSSKQNKILIIRASCIYTINFMRMESERFNSISSSIGSTYNIRRIYMYYV